MKLKQKSKSGYVTRHTKIATSDALLRKTMFCVFRGECFYSGRKLSGDNFHIDHVVPTKVGGKSCISNYVLCEKTLNLVKSGRYEETFEDRVLGYANMALHPKVVALYNRQIKKLQLLERKKIDSLKNKTGFNSIAEYNANRSQTTLSKLRKVILEWDKEKHGKISMGKVIKNFPVSKKSVEKYWKQFENEIRLKK